VSGEVREPKNVVEIPGLGLEEGVKRGGLALGLVLHPREIKTHEKKMGKNAPAVIRESRNPENRI
jgi:hypothetical protein